MSSSVGQIALAPTVNTLLQGTLSNDLLVYHTTPGNQVAIGVQGSTTGILVGGASNYVIGPLVGSNAKFNGQLYTTGQSNIGTFSNSGPIYAASFNGPLIGNASSATNASNLVGTPDITIGKLQCSSMSNTGTLSNAGPIYATSFNGPLVGNATNASNLVGTPDITIGKLQCSSMSNTGTLSNGGPIYATVFNGNLSGTLINTPNITVSNITSYGAISNVGTFSNSGTIYTASMSIGSNSSNTSNASSNTLDVYGSINFTGSLLSNGIPFISASASGGAGGSFSSNSLSNLIPATSSMYDLGSDQKRWRNLYLAGNAISFGDGTLVDTTNWNYLVNYVIPTSAANSNIQRSIFTGGTQNHSAFISTDQVYVFGRNEQGQLGLGDQADRALPTLIPSITNAKQVVCGNAFTAALLSDGTCVAFGDNSRGQLGDGTTISRFTPTPVNISSVSSVIQIAAGFDHVMYLLADGSVKTFGNDSRGQLGGNAATRLTINSTPTTFLITPTSAKARFIAAGAYHSIVLLDNGTTLLCGDNSGGQLGASQTTYPYITLPGPLAGVAASVLAAAGDTHTLIVVDTGIVYTFGTNTYGQLGRGTAGAGQILTTPTAATVIPANGTLKGSLYSVGAGKNHSVVITNTGATYVFGDNSQGQLGIGQVTTTTNIPTLIPNYSALTVACGATHTLLLLNASLNYPTNTVVAFGTNTYGQLGDAQMGTTATTTIGGVPQPMSTTRWLPNRISESSVSRKILAQGSTTNNMVIVDTQGTMTISGDNSYGQYGNTDAIQRTIISQDVGLLHQVSRIDTRIVMTALGNAHVVALDSAGSLWAWGYNGDGQLGMGTSDTTNRYVPQLVNTTNGTSSLYNKTIVAIACGQNHTLALDSTGQLHAWGYNPYGQLGMGTSDTTQRNVPQLVNTTNGTSSLYNKTIVAIAGGIHHTLALDSSGQLHAWGYNPLGNLGMGTSDTTNRYVPQLVNTTNGTSSLYNKTIVAIACGQYYILALDNTGQVHAWGYNGNGQLGMGTSDTTNRYVPQLVNTTNGTSSLYNKTIVAIACGGNHTLALDSTGQLHAWGNNGNGNLGMAASDTTQRYVPQLVNTTNGTSSLYNKTIVAIACGYYHTLALDSTGQLHAWGNNGNGQLANGTLTDKTVPQQLTSTSNTISIASSLNKRIISPGIGQHKLFRNKPRIPTNCIQVVGLNTRGQLGDGTTKTRYQPITLSLTTTTGVTVVATANGSEHSAAVLSNGQVLLWGRNDNGQCGVSSLVDVPFPTALAGINNAVDVACGSTFTLIKATDGTVFSLGSNTNGELGRTTTGTIVATVGPVSILTNVNKLVAGTNHAAALTNAGQVYIWGLNTSGQTGQGTFTGTTTTPTLVTGLTASGTTSKAIALSCGGNHTVITCADGYAYTTGLNTYGQCGRVQNTNRQVQIRTVDATTGVGSIWTTADYTALFTLYSTTVPMYFTYANYLFSIQFGALDASTLYRAITVMKSTDGGTTWTNGLPTSATLPIVTSTSTSPTSTIIELASFGLTAAWPNLSTFAPTLPLGTNAQPLDAACGDNHTALLMGNGSIRSFGRNNMNQLGITGPDRFKPTRASITFDPQSVAAISAATNTTFAELLNDTRDTLAFGEFFAVNYSGMLTGNIRFSTVLTTSGTLYNAGDRWYGQLGDNYGGSTTSSTQSTVSSTVTSQGSLVGTRIVTLASSRFNNQDYTVAIDSSSQLHAWGNNNQGQLGMAASDTTTRYVPQLVNTTNGTSSLYNKTIVAIACGYYHTLALDSTGQLHAWGNNGNGQLGMGTSDTTVRYVPQLVNTTNGTSSLYNKTIVAIACGGFHTLALDSTGQLHAWGNNGQGQLGMGTSDTTQRNVPQLVNTTNGTSSLYNKTIVAIACGGYYTLALDNTGQLHAWGRNDQGQLGMAASDTTSRYVPQLVNTTNGTSSLYNKTIVAIVSGYDHTLALDSIGQLHAWGGNSSGQLGMGTSDITVRYVPQLVNTTNGTSSLYNKIIVAIAGGNYYTLALDTTGQVHAWGQNTYGQLLTNNTTQYNIPTLTTVPLLWPSTVAASGGTTPLLLNFTGQHRCFLSIDGQEGQNQNIINQLEGLIVVSDKGRYVNPELTTRTHGPSDANDALPIVSLCTTAKDKRVFGVISSKVDMGVSLQNGQLQPINNSSEMDQLGEEIGDVRAQINAIGDGALWVLECIGTSLVAGDLITTSSTKGYGQVQEDDCMRASTVAKLTMDCNFDPILVPLEQVETLNGHPVLDQTTMAPIWTQNPEQTQPEYKIRHVNVADGTLATLEEYTASIEANDGLVRRAALLGCTYHSG